LARKQRRAIITPHVWHRVGDEHRLADNKRGKGRQHEATDRKGVIGEQEICRKYDKVEAGKKENGWRQRLAHFVQKASAYAAGNSTGGFSTPAAATPSLRLSSPVFIPPSLCRQVKFRDGSNRHSRSPTALSE